MFGRYADWCEHSQDDEIPCFLCQVRFVDKKIGMTLFLFDLRE